MSVKTGNDVDGNLPRGKGIGPHPQKEQPTADFGGELLETAKKSAWFNAGLHTGQTNPSASFDVARLDDFAL